MGYVLPYGPSCYPHGTHPIPEEGLSDLTESTALAACCLTATKVTATSYGKVVGVLGWFEAALWL